ncbi:MAG: hypothetical protein L6R42_000120 [Xanthoria sp. 1 TBL-2021]|nr:MAG: hypothetical protein L6R42_000120 [Xanthoria sp. 1 TBL-2021]
MQLPTILLSALAAIPSLAAPAPAPASSLSMMASAAPQWTLKSFLRTCNAADTSCDYSFSIDTHAGAATPCAYHVTGTPASRTTYNSIQCGSFVISSTWSGQFGPTEGFQTLGVVQGRTIVYPAYKDNQLVNGRIVAPDQSYAPQNLP